MNVANSACFFKRTYYQYLAALVFDFDLSMNSHFGLIPVYLIQIWIYE